MSAPIPCPCCGSDIGPGHEACSTCGYTLSPLRESNAGGSKCARCGAMMPQGFDFCPVCGQDQRVRLRRPPTQELRIGMTGSSRPSSSPHAIPIAPMPQPPPMGAPMSRDAATAAGRTVVPSSAPPSSFGLPLPPPPPMPPGGYAPPVHIDRTMPAPSSPVMPGGHYPQIPYPQVPPPPPPAYAASSRSSAGAYPPPPPPPRSSQGQGSLIAAVVDADTMQPPAGMPAIEADISDDDRTVPESHHRASRPSMPPLPGGEDDRTVPHARMHPVAIAPVRASISPATQPDRPGGFSGGPGHGPLPTVNRAKSSTLAPIQPTSTSRAVVGSRGMPRLVLVARDGSEGESFPLQDEQMTIGRTHGDLLFPEDPFLSPMHVRLQRTGKGLALFDAGSTNGVYLRIRGSAPVYPGDSFMIGHQLLRLENIDTQVQERPPAIDGTRVFGTPLQPAWGCVRQVGRGGIVGDKYYLRGSQVVFGREGGDVLFPNDPFVSREHARLRLELHGQTMAVFLEDLESANGSYIRIRGSAEMASMDTFRIGDQILRLRLD
jgi:pSer/pThr/pTyr-binding forkhead associated (FHA) protein